MNGYRTSLVSMFGEDRLYQIIKFYNNKIENYVPKDQKGSTIS